MFYYLATSYFHKHLQSFENVYTEYKTQYCIMRSLTHPRR